MAKPKSAPQIADGLRERIAAGEFGEDGKLPSVRQIMAKTGAAAGTVHQAITILTSEGLLVGRHGLGTYVRTKRRYRRRLSGEIHVEYERAVSGDDERGIFEDALGLDDKDVEVRTRHRKMPADQRVADHLGIDPGAPLLMRFFHYLIDGDPFQVARFYMPAHLAEAAGLPAAERKGLGSISHLLKAGVAVDLARYILIVRRPTPDEAASLAIPAGTSVMERTRILYADTRPVEVAIGVVAADQIELEIDVPLKGAPR